MAPCPIKRQGLALQASEYSVIENVRNTHNQFVLVLLGLSGKDAAKDGIHVLELMVYIECVG